MRLTTRGIRSFGQRLSRNLCNLARNDLGKEVHGGKFTVDPSLCRYFNLKSQ